VIDSAVQFIQLFFAFVDVPALILGMMLCAAWFMIRSAQKREDFDFGNMLRDENGKESATRLGVLAAIAFSSWFVMYDTIHNKAGDSTVLLIYLAVWSGAKVAEKLADALITKWGK
jgi:hypothetical protein